MDIIDLIMLVFFYALLFGVASLAYRSAGKYSWINKLTSTTAIFCYLVAWTIFGFIYRLDNNADYGCLVANYPVFSHKNVLYSGISLVLIGVAYIKPDKLTKSFLLCCELLFWCYKLYFLKGGYGVGLIGAVSTSVLFFDCIALSLRITLLKKVDGLPVRTYWVLVPSLLLMLIKCIMFRY